MNLRNLGQNNFQLSGKCPHCHHVAAFDQRGDYTRNEEPMFVFLFECGQCQGPVIAAVRNLRNGPADLVLPNARRSFPLPEYEDKEVVPSNITDVMRQVYAGIEVEAWMLVGMGIRLVVELMTAERSKALGLGIENVKLKARLKGLQEKYPGLEGPIQLADTIRVLGNDVAHNHEFICGPEEAAVAVELAEEMLEALYVLPARRKRLLESLPGKNDAIKPKL